MAKDGTNRGGKRAGAGRKPKALAEKIAEGKRATVMMTPAELEPVEMPPIKDYLIEQQRDGTVLCTQQVFEETYQWLRERGCEKLVSQQLIEQYAMSVGRWVHCEQTITRLGYIAKHPTTENPIQSPYIGMSREYMKQSQVLWQSIFQIVKENSSTTFEGTPQDDVMELLLRAKRG